VSQTTLHFLVHIHLLQSISRFRRLKAIPPNANSFIAVFVGFLAGLLVFSCKFVVSGQLHVVQVTCVVHVLPCANCLVQEE
jgi:hypothetical protein